MSFRSRKPPPVPQLPSQPSPVELMDVIDEISGTQTITVTGPDGKKRRVTQRLPRTPQEEAMFAKAEELMSQAVTNIEELYQYDPSSVADYQPFIESFGQINDERAADLAQIGNFADIGQKVSAFKKINGELVGREFDRQSRMNEEVLAKRGLQDSTLAAEQRAAFAGERSLATQQGDVNAELYGEDLMRRQLGRETDLYKVRESGREGRLQQAQTGYDLERQKQAELEALRRGAIAENQGFLDLGRTLRGDELQRSQMALQGSNSAINLASQQATQQNQRYANDVQRVGRQYTMDMDRFRATPARFGERLLDTGLSYVGQNLGSAAQAVPSMMGIPSFGGTEQPRRRAPALSSSSSSSRG